MTLLDRRMPLTIVLFVSLSVVARSESGKGFRLATFEADVTVPIGHGMMGGSWKSTNVADPLEAHGLVWLGNGKPIVMVAVDWCEIRNDAYQRWQEALAEAANTTPDRVLVSTLHQHDAPVADLEAERILRAKKAAGSICDLEFHERAVRRVADALKASLPRAKAITHLGIGQAKVDRVASNRRYVTPDGKVHFDRMSRTTRRPAKEAPEGTIDPWLKTISFWNGTTPVAAASAYAVHPMSYYGGGDISADFPGLARRKRQRETPDVKQIYVTGCAGNVTAGKYNDGSRENRPVLADRIHAAMVEAWKSTRTHELKQIEFRVTPLRLAPRVDAGYTKPELERIISSSGKPFAQCLAAMGLSWQKRCEADRPIGVPAIDFGVAHWLLLPGESYVEYQLAAQAARRDSFVFVSGYGEGATGYIPTEQHVADRDSNLSDWWWVAPGAEPRLLTAIDTALRASPASTEVQPAKPDSARLERIRAAKMPEITKPIMFDTDEADAILSALEIFPPDNAFNQAIDAWPRHPKSKEIVASIGTDKPLRYNPDMAFVIVPPRQARVNVKIIEYPDESDAGPFPVPDNIPIEGWPAWYQREHRKPPSLAEVQQRPEKNVGDRHAIVVDPVNRKLYEFFTFGKTKEGWAAGQASVFDLKTSKLRPDGWTSADAAGLPIFPAVVRHDEIKRGVVEHAMRVTVKRTRRAYIHPATHFASRHTDENLPRMGERLRLRADLDVTKFSPPVQAILKGLKMYGMFVADNGIDWAISVTPDPRIPVLHEELRKIKGSDFEVVVAPK